LGYYDDKGNCCRFGEKFLYVHVYFTVGQTLEEIHYTIPVAHLRIEEYTDSMQNIKDKVIIITGASDGIGAAAAAELKLQGARVVIVGRSPEKTKAVASKLDVPFYLADFSKLSNVRNLAERIKKDYTHIDVLANNAGGVMRKRTITVDGNEQTIQVNHLAPFLLTNLLMDTLIASNATVINTSSVANRLSGKLDLHDMKLEHGYTKFTSYGISKLMNILFTKELDKRYHDKGISAAAFHPGVVRTSFSVDSGGFSSLLYKSFMNRLLLSPEQGADTLVWLATTEPNKEWVSGEFYAKRKPLKSNKQAYDPKLAHDLWEESLKRTGLT
jgi:NAD(P)-dependent dehydrogenase (short-subunit alcohol dehydrogenase family)